MVRRSFAAARPTRRRRLSRGVVGPLAAMAITLAACGGDDSAESTSTTAAAVAEDAATGSAGATEPAPAPAPADGKVAAGDSSMMALQPVDYVYEGDMPALDGPAVAWRWTPGRTPTTDEIARVAAALGVTGDVTEQSADLGGGWTVGAAGATRLTVGEDAQGSWSLIADTAPVCIDAAGEEAAASASASSASSNDAPADAAAPDVATEPATVAPPDIAPCVEPVGIPTADQTAARATELLQALGLDPQEYALTADSQEWGAWADARLLVDGVAAPAITSFGFGTEGVLTYASGQLFAPQPAEQYERIGTAAALEQLRADQLRSYSPPVDPAVDPAATDIAPRPATAPADPDTPVSSPEARSPVVDSGNPVDTATSVGTASPPVPITVVLTSVEPGWWMVWAADGTVWLLPGYDFITDQGERISTPAVAQADLPDTGGTTFAEPAPGAGEAPAEPDLAPPLGD